MNRPICDDQDAIARMKSHAAKLKELDCPLAALPPEVLDEDRRLKQYLRRRVAQETARVDQDAAALLGTIGDMPPTD